MIKIYPSIVIRPPMDDGRTDWLGDHDLREEDGRRLSVVGWPTVVYLLGVVALAAGFRHEHVEGGSIPMVENMEPVDWLLSLSLLTIAVYLLVPLARNRARTREYLGRLRKQRFGVTSVVVVVAFFAVGLVAPVFFSEPTMLDFFAKYQPPVWSSVDAEYVIQCTGEMSNGKCHGSWKYPFGTTRTGKDLLPFVVLGARTAVEITLITGTILVPLGVGVGLVAAYAGGRVDAVLMRVAEVLQTIPAVVVYILFWSFYLEHRLLLLIGIFGLVNWGGLARLVRNETLKLQSRPYVTSARSSGASRLEIIRWHLVPNFSRQVLANVMLQLPLLVLTEAALSFVQLPMPGAGPGGTPPVTLGDPTVVSWGQILYTGILDNGLYPGWWVSAIPAAALMLFVLSLNRLGRVLSDVLDPKTE